MSRHNRTEPSPHSCIWGLVLILACVCSSLAGAQVHVKSTAKSPAKPDSPLFQAQAQLSKGDLAGAEASAWKMLSADPNDKDALTLLGIVRGQQQRYTEAESLFRRVVQLDSASASGHQNLGNALLAQGKGDDALNEYKEAESHAPGNVEIKVDLARLYAGKGAFAEGLSYLTSIPPAKFPRAAVPVKATCLMGLGRKREAAGLAMQAGGSPAIAIGLAEIYLRGGLTDEALQVLRRVSRVSDLPGQFYYLEGQALLNKGQIEPAETTFRRALVLDPDSVETLIALAEISAGRKKHAESLEFLQHAHQIAPDAVPVLRHMVIEAEAAGKGKVASDAAQELAQKSSDNLDDVYLASAAMLQGQNSAGALTALRNYTSQRPTDPKGWLALGMTCLIQKRYDEARTALEHSAQVAPGRIETEYQLGVLSSEESKQQEAVEHFEKVLQIQPGNAPALAKLGGLYLQTGDLDKAQAALQQSLASNPNNPDTEYKMAMVLSKLGKTDESREHMRHFQKLKQEMQGTPAPSSSAAP
jgi:tetratricopeptide (TPR) repeat protein